MKIGLCLSGGGARGAAHIGVIQALTDHDIVPDIVSGTSAGALVGAMYCSGMAVREMLAISRQGSLLKTLKFGLPDRGFGNLNFLRKILENHLEQREFEQLEKKLFVTATNLISGRPEYFSKGPLIEPILASCAVPGMLSPIEFNGNIYSDGGTMENFPVDPLLAEADYIIGVNLLPKMPVSKKGLKSFVGILGRTFDLSIYANAGKKLNKTNITISPLRLVAYGIFDFSKADQIFEVGYEATMKVMDIIQLQLETAKAED